MLPDRYLCLICCRHVKKINYFRNSDRVFRFSKAVFAGSVLKPKLTVKCYQQTNTLKFYICRCDFQHFVLSNKK